MPFKDPEKQKASVKRYVERNKELVRERQNRWKQQNKDYLRKYWREYRRKNPELAQLSRSKWSHKEIEVGGVKVKCGSFRSFKYKYGKFAECALISHKLSKEVRNEKNG